MFVNEAVQWAEEHLFDRNSVVLECQVWQEALGRARGEGFSVSELKEFTQRRGYIRDEARPGEVTMREVLLREWEIVQTAKEGIGDCLPLVANPRPANPQLDNEQRQALESLLRSTNGVSVFRGGAGTGKSFVLRELVEQLRQSGRSWQAETAALLDQGNFTWRAGERELQDLQADTARLTSRMEVAQISIRGWHEESKLWFFEDMCFTPEGAELLPDKNGIIWHEGQGYKLSKTDHEGEHFRQKFPLMKPGRELKLVEGKFSSGEKTAAGEEEAVRQLLTQLLKNFYETLGGYDGFMALGLVLAYGDPTLFREMGNQFPGLWLHGEVGQGKTSIARWLMQFWGFDIKGGMILKDSTKVGLAIALQQYGNLPVWLEEFQIDSPDWMIEKIKNIYGRETGGKKTFGDQRREILASAIVTGIARTTDAQVLSRYAHVAVASQNRLAPHFDWFEEHSSIFFLWAGTSSGIERSLAV